MQGPAVRRYMLRRVASLSRPGMTRAGGPGLAVETLLLLLHTLTRAAAQPVDCDQIADTQTDIRSLVPPKHCFDIPEKVRLASSPRGCTAAAKKARPGVDPLRASHAGLQCALRIHKEPVSPLLCGRLWRVQHGPGDLVLRAPSTASAAVAAAPPTIAAAPVTAVASIASGWPAAAKPVPSCSSAPSAAPAAEPAHILSRVPSPTTANTACPAVAVRAG